VVFLKEMETRIVDINVDIIREKLISMNAALVKKENQVNRIYDFTDKRLLDSKGYARIRIVGDLINNSQHYYMTTKKIITQNKYKVMEENEIEISDNVEGENIFFSLGLILCKSIDRYRESYRYKNSLIEIDINDISFCPFPYIEIETCNENELEEIVHKLGYTIKDTTSKTIFELIEEYNAKKVE